MIDGVEAMFDIGIQGIFGLMANGREDRFDGIVTGASWSKAIAVGFKARFPFGFQGVFDQRLAGSFSDSGDAQSPLLGRARFRNPGASNRSGRAIQG